MRAGILELPTSLRRGGSTEVLDGEAPPLRLLGLAQRLGDLGWDVETGYVTAAQVEAGPGGDEGVGLWERQDLDRLLVPFSFFNWPTVRRFLATRRRPDQWPPVVLTPLGPAPAVPRPVAAELGASLDRSGPPEAGVEVAPGGLDPGLPPVERFDRWPRWDRGLSTTELWGFPLDRQPHPWNLPVPGDVATDALADWHHRTAPVVATTRDEVWSLGRPPGRWDRDGMDVVGRASRSCLQAAGRPPALIVRLEPGHLLTPTVAVSLSVLPVRSVELLAGSCNPHILGALGVGYGVDEVERALAAAASAGLAERTVLSVLVGLPGETGPAALEGVKRALELAGRHSARGVRVAWWLNVPGSRFWCPDAAWEDHLARDGVPVAAVDPGPASSTAVMGPDERLVLEHTVDLVRLAHEHLDLVGPSLL